MSAVSSIKFLELATRKELASTNESLAVAGIQNDVDGTITEEQLDRRNSEQQLQEEIQEAFTKNNVNEVAAAVRIAHEATRAQRDIQILECSHKQLMLGCYRTMYQRKLKLENKIMKEDYV